MATGGAMMGASLTEPLVESAIVDGPHTIDDYVAMSLAQNPRIQAAEQRVQALRCRIPQARSLPDPQVSTNTYLAPVQTAAGEQRFALGVSQKVVRADRRNTRAAIAAEEMRAAQAEWRDVQLQIAAEVRKACYQLEFVRQSISITREDLDSLAQIAQVIERQYRVVRNVSQQDVLNVQIEQSMVENDLSDLTQKERSLQARLARLLSVDPSSQLLVNIEHLANQPPTDVEGLLFQARQQRPDLQAQWSRVRRDQRKIGLAQLERFPDVTVGLNWINTSSSGISPVANGDDAVLLGIGFNLPVYRERIRAAMGEARASSAASCSELQSLRNEADEEILDLVARNDSAREMLELVEQDIIPKASRTLDLSIEAYQNGEVEYVQLIENWRTLLRYRLSGLRLQSELDQLSADLHRATGNLAVSPAAETFDDDATAPDASSQADYYEQ
ncbi:MAG: TolC family protein [Pirellulaceae bacterium]